MADETYHTISADDLNAKLADAFVAREQEVCHYDINILNYEMMLEGLPQGDWPADLAPYKGRSPDTYPVESIDEISNLEFRDRIASLLRTEKIERGKAARVLATLQSRLSVDTFASLIAAAKSRIPTAV